MKWLWRLLRHRFIEQNDEHGHWSMYCKRCGLEYVEEIHEARLWF